MVFTSNKPSARFPPERFVECCWKSQDFQDLSLPILQILYIGSNLSGKLRKIWCFWFLRPNLISVLISIASTIFLNISLRMCSVTQTNLNGKLLHSILVFLFNFQFPMVQSSDVKRALNRQPGFSCKIPRMWKKIHFSRIPHPKRCRHQSCASLRILERPFCMISQRNKKTWICDAVKKKRIGLEINVS